MGWIAAQPPALSVRPARSVPTPLATCRCLWVPSGARASSHRPKGRQAARKAAVAAAAGGSGGEQEEEEEEEEISDMSEQEGGCRR